MTQPEALVIPAHARRAAGLAFFTALATLALQILIHRVVSAKLLNNYAFLVISLTMLGFAFSGVVLSKYLTRFLGAFNEVIGVCAGLFAISTVLCSAIFYHAWAGEQAIKNRPDFVATFFKCAPLALLYAVPFIFCGLILGMLLSATTLPTRRIYFFDLLGSACGALLVLPAISSVGVEWSMLGCCALLPGAACLLAPPRGGAARTALAAAGIVVVLAGVFSTQAFKMRYPDGSMLSPRRDGTSWARVEHITWDPVSRIEVSDIDPPTLRNNPYPCLVGSNLEFHKRFRKMITQNNFAFTFAVDYDGRKDTLRGIEETIYAAAYQARGEPPRKTMIIGVGGGFDILTALYFGAPDITAVEINAATIRVVRETYRDYFRAWADDPAVKLIHGDGRHVLARMDEKFDIIQLSGVDSYSGTAGSVHVFSENYLYTSEAFDLYLSRLSEGGIINMMRLELVPPREMLRALITAVQALRRAGIQEPWRHIIMVTATNKWFTALLVKKSPFSLEEVKRLAAWCGSSEFFKISAAPGINNDKANAYQIVLAHDGATDLGEFLHNYPFDIEPVDDNRPFFFKYSFWWHIFPANPIVWQSVPVMEYSLIILFMLIGMAALVCIYLPLRFAAAGGTPSVWRYIIIFAGTATGYLAIEVALLQKFGLFLGHPNYALSVVLAALLLATGLGSLYSERITSVLRNMRFTSYALAAVVLAEYALALPALPGLVAQPFALRAAMVVLLVLPVGMLLGTFVPTALSGLKLTAPAFVPWAWGINGIFSVLAPVLSIGLSMTWGINALLLASLPVYLLVGAAYPDETHGLSVPAQQPAAALET